MSPADTRNMGHSVYQRLLNIARQTKQEFNLLLLRYGMERFLYRLSISVHKDRFVLKGASMFLVWRGQNYRVTRDADLLGFGRPELEAIAKIFTGVCEAGSVAEDGMLYLSKTLHVKAIREQQGYDGVRLKLEGRLHQARIPLRIDIGFGDAVTPSPERVVYPALLDAPPPRLKGYPRYTMVAEKFEAMVRLGLANSRMKDFYDMWLLSRIFEFEGRILCEAIKNTFARRETPVPTGIPFPLTEAFFLDDQKEVQWRAFVRNAKPIEISGDLQSTIETIVLFLVPPLRIFAKK